MTDSAPLACIYEAIRSPRGRARADGGLHRVDVRSLVAQLFHCLEQRLDFDPTAIDDAILGCVTQVGEQGANIAKTSLHAAAWPDRIPALTVNRFCSSGIDAIALGAAKIASGLASAVVAGGVEMLSRTAMLADRPDAFLDPAQARQLGMYMMGNGADRIATAYGVSREQADAVALQSHRRAAAARSDGHFKSIIPIKSSDGEIALAADELIRPDTNMASLAALPAAFAESGAGAIDAELLRALQEQQPSLEAIDHVHTVGNSPAMADGAALLLLASEQWGRDRGLTPRAVVRDAASVCDDHRDVVGGCVLATRTLLQRQQLSCDDIDLFELHEAFAATVIKAQQDLGIDDQRLNVNGGCIALGHPLGATGAIMAGTLLDELEIRDLRRGIVAASGAAGLGSALLLERI